MHQVQGVIARAQGAPVEVVTVNVPDPGPGEALVRVQACGVCHTDFHYREGGIGDDYPYLLGHEAAQERRKLGEVRSQGVDLRVPTVGVDDGHHDRVPDEAVQNPNRRTAVRDDVFGRVGDPVACGSNVAQGSPNVFAGG